LNLFSTDFSKGFFSSFTILGDLFCRYFLNSQLIRTSEDYDISIHLKYIYEVIVREILKLQEKEKVFIHTLVYERKRQKKSTGIFLKRLAD
jgi:hypothetical protein